VDGIVVYVWYLLLQQQCSLVRVVGVQSEHACFHVSLDRVFRSWQQKLQARARFVSPRLTVPPEPAKPLPLSY
jgi:hypothetical protein